MANKEFITLLKQKKGFLFSVYMVLILQLAITFSIVYSFRNMPNLSKATKQSILVYMLLSLGLILLLTLVPMPIWLKFILFTLFAIVNGGLLHSVSAVLPVELINQSLIGTIGVFVALSFVGFILAAFGFHLGWLGLILLAGLIGLLVASLIVMFMSKSKEMKGVHKALLIIGLIIFSIYIMYGTNIMLQKDYDQDFISAAIDLYLSFINVFIRILSLESME